MDANAKNTTYKIRLGDTLSSLARRFGVSRADLVSWNNIKDENRIMAGSDIVVRAPTNEDYPMSNEKPDDSMHAADHIDGVMDEMDAVFNDVKAAAAGIRAKLRAEGNQMKSNLDTFDQRVVGRMRSANSRFQRMLGGNGGPPLEIEDKTE